MNSAKTKIRKSNIYKTIMKLKTLARIMRVKPFYFIIQIGASFLVALLEGLSLVLLIPLAKGVIERDFSFLENVPVFKTIIASFPQLLKEAHNTSLFLLLVVTIFSAAVIKNILDYFFRVYVSRQKQKYLFNIKKTVFGRCLSFGKLYFDRTSQGYINQLLRFLNAIVSLFDGLADLLISIFTFVVYSIIMLRISWELTMFSLMVFPILAYSLRWIIQKIRKTAKAHTDVTIQLSREVFNILSCIALVKAYDKEEDAKAKFNKISDKLRKLDFSLEKKFRIIRPLQEIISLVALLLLISAVAFRFIKGQAGQVSGYLLFFILLRRSIPLFGHFNNFRAQIARTEAPMEKILEVMDDKDKFVVPSGKKVFDGLRRGIEFRNVSFSYSRAMPVLKDVNFTIEKDKMTAIVGPTGAGKTTIISLIIRFYDCPPATIFIDGIDIREFTLESLKSHMTLVSQEIFLFNDTLRNNINYGLERKISEEELVGAAKKARLHDFIMKLPQGFDTEVGDRGVKLSGGERQRVSIARALIRNSEILILDEATSALDTHTERLIQETIEEAVRGRTTIVIAHRLSTIKHADKVVVIEEGRFVEEGTLGELLEKKGKFFQYWEEQKFF